MNDEPKSKLLRFKTKGAAPGPEVDGRLDENEAAEHPGTPTSDGPGLLDDVIMGLRFYSRLPTGDRPHEAVSLNRMARALPFTSVIIGIGPAAILMIGGWLGMPPLFAAGLAVAALVVTSGAMAEDGLADAADGLFGGQDVERRLEIMQDSRHGTYGVAALALFLLLRVAALGSLPNPFAAAGMWLAAMVMARSGALWLTLALPPARSGGASANAGRVGKTAFVIGMAFALIISFVLAGFAAGLLGLLLAYLAAALLIWGWVKLCRHLIGGQTGDLIGALQALIEIAVLVAFMIFA